MKTTLTLRADRTLLRADAESRRHVLVELRAPEAPPRAHRLPVNLAFVIDRSGSMHGEKIANARIAVIQGIRSLRECDRFAVAAYDTEVNLVVASTPATAAARDAGVAAVEQVFPRGGTDLHAGWSAGCQQVSKHFTKDAVARCLLLTDGLANEGVTDHDEIVRQCAASRDGRVVTTTFGVGAEFDETLLRRMADAGGGNFQFIESAAQIADFVASEVGEALATRVREGVLVVDAGEGAVVKSLNDFPCRQEGGEWRIAFGSLYGGQRLAPLLRVTFPAGEARKVRDVSVRVEDQVGSCAEWAATARFTWAGQDKNAKEPRDLEIDREVARLDAARAERDALERNRAGDYKGARKAMEACVARIREYAGEDDELRALVATLQKKAERYGRAMDKISSKHLYSMSSSALRGRLVQKGNAAPGSGQKSLVPSEWDAQAAVEQALKLVALQHHGLLKVRDWRQLAEQLAHLDQRGCLLDIRQDQTGSVVVRLEAAGLCAPCRAVLEGAGLPSESIEKVVEALRLMGAPSGVVH